MRLFRLLILFLLSWPALAEDDEIIPNKDGWWGTGYLVGIVPTREWDVGLIWEAGEFRLLAGGGYSGEYPPETYKVTVEPENKDKLWNKFSASSKPVVVKYIYPFFRNILKNPNFYFLEEIQEPDASFYDSDSYKEFPDGISQTPYHENGFFFKHREAFGKPVHVSRWGKVISQRCTIYLHLGGVTTIAVDEQIWTDEWVYDPVRGRYIQKPLRYSHKGTKVVPNIVQLDTFSEKMCRYLEEATLSRSELYVEYSGFEAQPQEEGSSLANPVVHSALVTPSGSGSGQ